jgi:hypothetical protein
MTYISLPVILLFALFILAGAAGGWAVGIIKGGEKRAKRLPTQKK